MKVRSWRFGTGLGAALVLSTAITAAAPAAATATRAAGSAQCRTGADDFDGNGGTDLAVGALRTGGDEDEDYVPPGQVVVEMRTKSGFRTERIDPPSLPIHHIGDFGATVAEVDLATHHDPSQPCSALAIGAGLFDTNADDDDVFVAGVVLLYRYDTSTHRFVELNMITGTDIDPALTDFGAALAGPQMRSDRPEPRQPVLYVGASSASGPYDRGAVVRVVLTAQGSVSSSQIIAPGTTATPEMPLTYDAAGTGYGTFGSTLRGTPDANQVIIGDPAARHGGAVVVWNRVAPAQLLTEPRLGNRPTRKSDAFGRTLWLSTDAANASGGDTYLFIGAPWRSVRGKTLAGAAFQLRYNRSTSPARAVVSSAKYWTQARKGVAGAPHSDNQFGSSFESLSNGKSPKFLVGIPDEKNPTSAGGEHLGAIDVLGDGRAFYAATLPHGRYSDSLVGEALGSWRNVDDYLAKDRWPAPGPGKWSRLVVVGDENANAVLSGLPAGSWHAVQKIDDGIDCSYEDGSCGFGRVMTASGGG